MSENQKTSSNSTTKLRGDNLSEDAALILPPILGLDNDYSFIEELHNRTWENGNRPMYTEKVSIIIPVYNRKEKLAKTIAALSHQTYPHELFEVIIADDGSSDNPQELCETFKDYFSISYIRQEDMGYRLSEIRNKGIAAATHEQIIILDCDMLPLPTLVESYMKYAHVSDKVVLIGGRRYVNTDNVSFEEIIKDISSVSSLPSVDTATGKVPTNGVAPTEDWRYKIYRTTNNLKNSKFPFRAFCGGNVCFHKSLISAVGGFDEDFKAWGAEDTEFGFRVYNHGYWFVPVHGADALHQEPPGGSNETDRDAGKSITQPILVEKCPSRYRKYEKNRRYEVPKVSVFIPAYNCEDFIEDAINSVINQTYTDLEILVTDDGGTDKTADIVRQMAEHDSRIRFFPKSNGGIGSACNHMLSFAKGEYALQLDGDDVLAPDTVEKMVQILDNSPIGFVYGDAFLVDQSKI